MEAQHPNRTMHPALRFIALRCAQARMLELSDVISFHNYGNPQDFLARITSLQAHGRPVWCTEYMARSRQSSTFDPLLGMMSSKSVSAFNWGLVAGRTHTIFPWSSWNSKRHVNGSTSGEDMPRPIGGGSSKASLWFHDILTPSGHPAYREEAIYIRHVIKSHAILNVMLDVHNVQFVT